MLHGCDASYLKVKECTVGIVTEMESVFCEEAHQRRSHSVTGTEFNVRIRFLVPQFPTPNRPHHSMDWRIFLPLVLVLFLFADLSQGIVHLLEIQFEFFKFLYSFMFDKENDNP